MKNLSNEKQQALDDHNKKVHFKAILKQLDFEKKNRDWYKSSKK